MANSPGWDAAPGQQPVALRISGTTGPIGQHPRTASAVKYAECERQEGGRSALTRQMFPFPDQTHGSVALGRASTWEFPFCSGHWQDCGLRPRPPPEWPSRKGCPTSSARPASTEQPRLGPERKHLRHSGRLVAPVPVHPPILAGRYSARSSRVLPLAPAWPEIRPLTVFNPPRCLAVLPAARPKPELAPLREEAGLVHHPGAPGVGGAQLPSTT